MIAVGGSSLSYGVESSSAPGQFDWFTNVIPINATAGSTLANVSLLPDRNEQVLVSLVYSSGGASTEGGGFSIGGISIPLYRGAGADWSKVTTVDNHLGAPQINGIVNGDEVTVFTAAFSVSAWSQSAADAQWEEQGFGLEGFLTAVNPWVNPVTGRVNALALEIAPGPGPGPGNGTPYYAEALTTPIAIGQWTLTSLADGESAVVVVGSQTSGAGLDTNFAVLADPVTKQMRAFAIDLNGQVCVLEQQATGWAPLLPLGHQATALYPLNHPDGFSQVVATSADGIFILSYSSETEEWTRDDVEIAFDTEAQSYNCYSIEIAVTDAHDVRQPLAAVSIKSSDPVEARINGNAAFLDPEKAVNVLANVAGNLTIEIATGLDCAELLVNTGGMPSGSWVSVVPQIEVKAQIEAATASGATLLEQRDRFGNFVVTGPLRSSPAQADAVAQALHRCCRLVDTAGTHLSAVTGPLGGNRRTDRVRYMPPGETRSGRFLNLAEVEPVSWSIDFTSGPPVFTILSDEQAAGAASEFDSLIGFGFSWGDVWGSIKNGFSQVRRIFVQVIVDPVTKAVTAIQATVEALIEGVERTFAAVIDLVEQVFDVIEGIFAQIKTFVQKLIDWLAFFFDWDDILRTKHALKYLLGQYGALCDGMLARMQPPINGVLLGAAADVTSWADQIGASLGSRNPLTVREENPAPDYIDRGRSHNIVQSNLFDTLTPGATGALALPMFAMPDMSATATSLVALIEEFAAEIAANAAFGPMTSYFDSLLAKLKSDPDAFLTTAFAGMIQALASFAAAGLRILASLVDRMIGLLRQILRGFVSLFDAEVDIPVVSSLYKLITFGDTLTYGDVITLAAGVTLTLTYKIAFNEAPFQDDGSLGAFKEAWAASALLQLAAGTGTSSSRLLTPPPPTPKKVPVEKLGLLGCRFLNGVADAVADVMAVPNRLAKPASSNQKLGVSIFTAAVDGVAVMLSFPWAKVAADPIHGAPDFKSADGLTAMSWMLDVIATGIDVSYIVGSRQKLVFEKYGPVATTAIGVLQYAIYSGIIAIQVDAHDWDGNAQAIDIGSMLEYLPAVSKVIITKTSVPALTVQMCLDFFGPVVGGLLVFQVKGEDE